MPPLGGPSFEVMIRLLFEVLTSKIVQLRGIFKLPF
jgi:hypothetical protein